MMEWGDMDKGRAEGDGGGSARGRGCGAGGGVVHVSVDKEEAQEASNGREAKVADRVGVETQISAIGKMVMGSGKLWSKSERVGRRQGSRVGAAVGEEDVGEEGRHDAVMGWEMCALVVYQWWLGFDNDGKGERDGK